MFECGILSVDYINTMLVITHLSLAACIYVVWLMIVSEIHLLFLQEGSLISKVDRIRIYLVVTDVHHTLIIIGQHHVLLS